MYVQRDRVVVGFSADSTRAVEKLAWLMAAEDSKEYHSDTDVSLNVGQVYAVMTKRVWNAFATEFNLHELWPTEPDGSTHVDPLIPGR